jgi:hypothetical protein
VEKPLAEKIIATTSQASGKVLRGQGISLHEADALDIYASDDQLKQARLLDTDIHWWEIAPDQLERFNGVLIYTNAEGFRYYIPAYMTLALRTWQSGSLSVDAQFRRSFPLRRTHRNAMHFLMIIKRNVSPVFYGSRRRRPITTGLIN